MSEVKRYDISAFGGMSMDECIDGAYVNYEDYAALEAKCAALAAENAKLADCANFYRLGFRPVKGVFGIEWKPTEQLLDDCGNTAIEAIKTQATDAFLAEVRAQGVEMFGQYHNFSEKLFIQKEAQKFAAQLRKVGEQK